LLIVGDAVVDVASVAWCIGSWYFVGCWCSCCRRCRVVGAVVGLSVPWLVQWSLAPWSAVKGGRGNLYGITGAIVGAVVIFGAFSVGAVVDGALVAIVSCRCQRWRSCWWHLCFLRLGCRCLVSWCCGLCESVAFWHQHFGCWCGRRLLVPWPRQ
jgi:hypothetical protein